MTVSSIPTEDCATTVKDGRWFLVTCTATGFEGIWSPGEASSYRDLCREHRQAHDDAFREELRRIEFAGAVRNARWAYHNTEPGHPARRAIAGYEAFL